MVWMTFSAAGTVQNPSGVNQGFNRLNDRAWDMRKCLRKLHKSINWTKGKNVERSLEEHLIEGTDFIAIENRFWLVSVEFARCSTMVSGGFDCLTRNREKIRVQGEKGREVGILRMWGESYVTPYFYSGPPENSLFYSTLVRPTDSPYRN